MEMSQEVRLKSVISFIEAFILTKNIELLEYAFQALQKAIELERLIQNDS
jgi:hypothetical protein